MATSELMRGPSISAQEQIQQEESTFLSILGSSTADSGMPLFPTVPTHVPTQGKDEKPRVEARIESSTVGEISQTRDRLSEPTLDYTEEEEMEEVLEELQDDEMEELVESEHYSSDSAIQLLGQETDTLPLLTSAQSICLSSLSSLLRFISSNTLQTAILGGPEVVDMLVKASDTVVAAVAITPASISSSTTSPVTPSYTLLEGPQSVDHFIAMLDYLPIQRVAVEGDSIDDTYLLFSLRDLIATLNIAKDTADLLDSRYLHLEGSDIVSPTTSQASSISPKDFSVSSPTSLAHQQARAQRANGLGRHYAAMGSSPLINSSPSTSREELRNPFADVVSRSQSILPEDRTRERLDRDVEATTRLIKTLRMLDKRSGEALSSLESSTSSEVAKPASPSESTPQSTSESKERIGHTWRQLQTLSKATQELIASRRTSLLTPNVDTRRGSTSPTTYSPTYSPSRGRSRRNSANSLSSPSASLHNVDAGDPVGEAVAAGFGVGATRSLSHLSSSHRTRNASTNTSALLPSTSMSMGPIVSRRGSTKSEGTASGSVHSAPPRYSEDSARNWSADFLLGSHRESESGGLRRDRELSGDTLDFSSKTLPAYNTTDSAYLSPLERKASSTSSLTRLDTKPVPYRSDEKAAVRNRGASDSSKMMALTSSSGSQQAQHHRHASNSSSTEYSARTSQDLRMVESSIERLYSAVPQLNDQRASSPMELKRQKSQNVLNLMDQLAKNGRMEDQRAIAPPESANRYPSVAASPDTHLDISSSSSTVAPSNSRLARRLGSISFGNLSLRLASTVLGSEGKGKEKEKSRAASSTLYDSSSTPTRANFDDLMPLANQVQAANERGFEDQRATIRSKGIMKKKPSKLDLMGVSTFEDDQDEVDLLDILASSIPTRKMANQDAMKRSPSQTGSASPLPSASNQPLSPLISGRIDAPTTRASSQNISSPLSEAPDGESIPSRQLRSGSLANESNRTPVTVDIVKAKTTSRSDVPLCYIAESQPRLGCISAHIWESQSLTSPFIDPLPYRIDSSDLQALIVTHQHSPITYLLPCQTLETSTDQLMSRQQDQWQIKLQAAGATRNEAREASAPLSAIALQKEQPTSLICNECLSIVAETSNIKQYLPLPSQHWEELIDAWMCHSDQELNQGMIDTQRKLDGHLGLQRGQARVSDAFVVMHPSHLARNASYQEGQDLRLRCINCKSTLGQCASSGAIKLFKFAIRPVMSLQACSSSLMGLVIANDLIRLSQAHATRHFLLQDDEEGETHLHLWLFLESFEVALSLPSPLMIYGLDNHKQLSSVSLPACKIFFRSPTLQVDSISQQTQRQAWAQPDLIEHIQYPKEVCQQLKHFLHLSSLSYPPTRRQFTSDWTVGFLQTALPLSSM